MSKSDRIAAFVETLPTGATAALPACYTGYFHCFNAQDYYEAHDVLEHLWLDERDNAFFKGLIQLAGAFVHLKKQHLRPEHPKDGKRLRPAVRLFRLAATNLAASRPHRMQLDVEHVCALIEQWSAAIAAADFRRNPWSPATAPRLELSAPR